MLTFTINWNFFTISTRSTRSTRSATDLLAGFRGTLVCDGYKVYPNAGTRLGFKTAGCLAHLRRKFILAEEAATKQKKAQRTRATAND